MIYANRGCQDQPVRHTDLQHPQLIRNNQPIENVTSHKHLGLVLSNDGTWHYHIDLSHPKLGQE